MSKPITIWCRWIPPNKETGCPGYYAHNHIEDGHSDRYRPKYKTPMQKAAWLSPLHRPEVLWRRVHAFLEDNYYVVPND